MSSETLKTALLQYNEAQNNVINAKAEFEIIDSEQAEAVVGGGDDPCGQKVKVCGTH